MCQNQIFRILFLVIKGVDLVEKNSFNYIQATFDKALFNPFIFTQFDRASNSDKFTQVPI